MTWGTEIDSPEGASECEFEWFYKALGLDIRWSGLDEGFATATVGLR